MMDDAGAAIFFFVYIVPWWMSWMSSSDWSWFYTLFYRRQRSLPWPRTISSLLCCSVLDIMHGELDRGIYPAAGLVFVHSHEEELKEHCQSSVVALVSVKKWREMHNPAMCTWTGISKRTSELEGPLLYSHRLISLTKLHQSRWNWSPEIQGLEYGYWI